MDIEELIEDAMEIPGVDKKKIIEIMAHGLREGKNEKETYEKVYRNIYGNHLAPEECNELIEMLYQGEEHGPKWTLDEVKNVASRLDYDFSKKPYTPEELRAAMHIKYYDAATPLRKSGVALENTGWGRMGDFFFTAEDEKPGALVDYYFYKHK